MPKGHENCTPEDSSTLLKIDADGTASLIDADKYQGCRTYHTAEELKREYGKDYSTTCIGPAGEQKLSSVSI